MEPFETTFAVRSYEVDAGGRARPTALLNYLQEAAGDHAHLLGIAVRDLLPHGLTWVLSRMRLKITGTAVSGEEVRVRTWPSTREGRFSCREFILTVGEGRPLAVATCSFAVLDLASRRPVVIAERLPTYPLIPRRAIDDDFPTIPRLSRAERELTFRVGWGELDVNRHLNNVVYAAWGLETVPQEVVASLLPVDLEIAFRAEARYGETVLSRSARLPDEREPAFLHQMVRQEDGAELARLVSRWRSVPVEVAPPVPDGLP